MHKKNLRWHRNYNGIAERRNISPDMIHEKSIVPSDTAIFLKDSDDPRIPPLRKILPHLDNWIWEAGTGNFFWTDRNYAQRAVPVEDDHTPDYVKSIPEADQLRIIDAFNSLEQNNYAEVIYSIGSSENGIQHMKLEVTAIRNEQGILVGLKGCGKLHTPFSSQPVFRETDSGQPENLPGIGNLSINLHTGKITFSRNMYRLLGYSPQEFYPDMEKFLSMIHPDDAASLNITDTQNYAEGKLTEHFRMYTEKGEIRHIRSYNKISQNEAGEKVINATLLDITESFLLNKMLQEKMAYVDMAIDNSIDIISAYDKDLICIAWNNKCEAEYGIPKQEALGKHARELIQGHNSAQVLGHLQQAVEGEFIQFQEQVQQNQPRYFERYFIPLRDDSGRIVGVLSTSHDITTIRNVSRKLNDLNQSLKEKNTELERSNSELASFSYIASHDLQEPLRKIQTFSRRLLETEINNLSSQGRDYFRRMESAAQRMQLLIDDLLTFSRTNTLPKDFQLVDLNDVLAEVKQELREVIEEKKAVIYSDHLPKANIILFQFRQLLENVLGNSLKYAKPEVPPQITITSTRINRDESHLSLPGDAEEFIRLDITDNGIGFDEQYAERIFELFQRLHGKHEYPGTGLGLAICRKIVKNHHGLMFSTGEPGKGATFTIIIPA